VGFDGLAPSPETLAQQFLQAGVGGFLAFRTNFFDALRRPTSVEAWHAAWRQACQGLPEGAPPPWILVDQEGGAVERLPYPAFPTLPPPGVFGWLPKGVAEAVAAEAYAVQAQHLAAWGVAVNCFPTLDVNLDPDNPIIGVRSFSDDPGQCQRLAGIALDAYAAAGVLAIGKHAPGHGHGKVDSHQARPILQFTAQEFSVFQQAMARGIPALMVSHGEYPGLQHPRDTGLPASCSPTVVGWLRQQYEGLLVSDDMCMGAITQRQDPVGSALAALNAGLDMLLYKQASAEEWHILNQLAAALEDGRLDPAQHAASLQRIARAKQQARGFPGATPHDVAGWAAVVDWTEDFATRLVAALPVWGALGAHASPLEALWVVPDLSQDVHYADEARLQGGWTHWLQAATGMPPKICHYPLTGGGDTGAAFPLTTARLAPGQGVCFVTRHPQRNPGQHQLLARLRAQFPEAPLWIIHGGDAHPKHSLAAFARYGPLAHWPLGCLRPPYIRALLRRFIHEASQ
jgi:beta-N-acetylhexosaminidase